MIAGDKLELLLTVNNKQVVVLGIFVKWETKDTIVYTPLGSSEEYLSHYKSVISVNGNKI